MTHGIYFVKPRKQHSKNTVITGNHNIQAAAASIFLLIGERICMGQTTVNQFVVFILGSNTDFKPAQQQKESVIGSGM